MLPSSVQYDIGAFTPPSVTITTTVVGVNPTTSEVQTIAVVASGGTFTITFSGQTTSALDYNASAATVQAALWALSNITDGDVTVTLSGQTYTLTWLASLGNVAQPTATITSLVQVVGRWLSRGFQNDDIMILPNTSPNYLLKFVSSNQDIIDEPDFWANSAIGNLWNYVEVVDLESGADINGTTWVAISTTTPRSFEFNTNTECWIGILVTTYVAGNLTGNVLLTNNS